MTRNEAIEHIALIIAEEKFLPYLTAEAIMNFIEANRMSAHAADEWEPESDEA